MFIDKKNRTVDYLAKKSTGILDSSIWWSNFPKDVANFSYKEYYCSRFNRLCNILVS